MHWLVPPVILPLSRLRFKVMSFYKLSASHL